MAAFVIALMLVLVIGFLMYSSLWGGNPNATWGKTIMFALALLFTFGSGLCAVGSAIAIHPVAILALAACVMGASACKAVFSWNKGLPVGRFHPLAQVTSAVVLTIAAYIIAANTMRFAG